MNTPRRLLAAASIAALILDAGPVRAVPIFWDGSSSNSWATSANFNTAIDLTGSDVAVGTAASDVVFSANGGGLNLNTNLAANRSILSLTYNGNATAPSTIANNVLTIAAGGLTVSPTSADHTITSTITAGATQPWAVPSGRLLTVAAVNGTNANVILSGGGTVLLTATGSLNKWDVRGSTLKLNGSNRLGDITTSVDLDATSILDFTNAANPNINFSDAWRGLNGAVGSTVLNYGTSTANVNLDLRPQLAGETYKFSGTFVNASPLGSLIMQGITTLGTQIIEANFPGSNNLQVLNGNLVLGNVNGAANLAITSIVIGRADTLSNTTGLLSSLVLDSSVGNHATQNRLENLEPILIRTNGQFKVIGNAAAATTETVGPIRAEISNTIHPHATVTLQDGGAGIEINSLALEHNTRTTLLVRGTGLGTGALGAGVTRLLFTNAPLQAPGVGAQRGVLPYIVGDNNPAGLGTDFVTNDVNGLRLLTAPEYVATLNSGIPSNVALTANAAPAGNFTDLSLKLGNAGGGVTVTVGAANTMTINSGRIAPTSTVVGSVEIAGGAILSLGAGPNAISGGKLTFGTKDLGSATVPHEGYIHALTAFNLDTTVTNNGSIAVSLSKSGAGLLRITKPQAYTGESTFTEGDVVVTGAHFLPASRTSIASKLTLSGLPSDSVGNLAGNSLSILDIGATTSLNIKGGADATWWGTVTGVGTAPVALTKSGAGTLTIRSVNGTARFNGAPLVVAGGGLQFFEPGPNASAAPSVLIKGNGTLTLNNGLGNDTFFNNNRIADAAPITIQRGAFTVTGSNNARVTEVVGAITLDGALSTFTIDADDSATNTVTSTSQGDVILTTASLLRLNKATIFVRGELGQDLAGTPQGSTTATFVDTNNAEGAWRLPAAPTLSHAATAFGTTQAAVIPWGTAAFGSGAAAATLGGLLTYDTTDGDSVSTGTQHVGFRPLTTLEYAVHATDVPSTVAVAVILNQNTRLAWSPGTTAANITLADDVTVRGLVLNNTRTSTSDLNLAGNVLTVESGLIVSTGTQDNQIINTSTAAAAITFGNNAATGYEGRIDGARRIDIDVPIRDNIVINGISTVVNAVSLTTDNTVYLGAFNNDPKDIANPAPQSRGWSGGTQINSGRIEIKLSNALPIDTILTIAETAELRLNNQDQEIRGLKGAGFVTNESNTLGNTSILTIFTQLDDVFDFTGTLRNRATFTLTEGALQIFKSGPGVQILSGVNTLTGDTSIFGSGTAAIVSEGTLLVNGSLVGRTVNDPEDLKGNAAAINNGILGGNGLINGNVSMNNSSVLSPGPAPDVSIGTFTVGSLSLAGGTTAQFDLTTPGVIGLGINDLVVVFGDLHLDGLLQIFPDSVLFGIGTYRLFNYGGTLENLGFQLESGFQALWPNAFVDYSTPGQVNLVVAVPEPNALLGLLGGAGFLLGRRRRRA